MTMRRALTVTVCFLSLFRPVFAQSGFQYARRYTTRYGETRIHLYSD